ncbi:MAG: C25 family cysteine peptidase [Acidobacteriota bacterium]
MKALFRLLPFVAVLLMAPSPAQAQVCGTPGKDGSPLTPITGIVNTYYPGAANVAANTSNTSILLGPATGASTTISAGDLLLVIQMQDASINSTNTANYGSGGGTGSGYSSVNGVGLYEFVRATSAVTLAGGTVSIVGAGTNSGLLNAYNMTDVVGQGQRRFQVVRVPQYAFVTIGAALTALAWNGSTGGILAFDASQRVALNSSTISVAGLGFRGGGGRDIDPNGGSAVDFVRVSTNLKHGSKAEGIAGTPKWVYVSSSNSVVDTGSEGYPNGSIARGAPGNAGGGGTDGDPVAGENSGGGGGGNGAIGGVGGNTWQGNDPLGGLGGVRFTQAAAARVVLGGGGGAGARENTVTAVASSGAAGGGFVIIRARLFLGTGTINADGAAAYNFTENDGGGGGGAGGSVIVLALTGNLTGLTVNARGGRGGDAWPTEPSNNGDNRHGPGGGGSGGAVFLSSAAASTVVTGGAHGTTTTSASTYGSADGGNGTPVTNMTAGQIPGVQGGAQCAAPTAVEMASFTATRYQGGVSLRWQTGYEVRNLGFNIYREQKGSYSKINPEPVAGSALLFGPKVALRAGFAYSWWDRGIADCGLRIAECEGIRYWIEDMDLNGHASMHGPFGVERSSGEEAPEVGKEQAPLLGAIGADAAKLGASAPVERVAKLLKPTAAGLAVQAGIASQQAVKLSVKHEGWYRVEQADLLAAGFPASADSLKLQLFVDGQEVPILVTSTSTSPGKGSKPIPAPWDGIEFYGIGIDSAFTDSHVYWLVAGSQNGLRIKTVPSKGGTPAPATFTFAVERRDKVVYFPSLQNGGAEKFFGPVIYNAQAVDQSVTLQHVASTGSATLDVSLQGYTDAPHSVRVLLNGSELGTVQFAGLAKGTAQYSIPQTSLLEGSNQVQFISPAGFSDITMVESVRMSYQHTNTADGNSLRFPATGSQQPTIAGFTSAAVRVLDVTNPGSPQEVETTVEQDGAEYSATVTVPGAGARTLLAFASDQKKTPAALVANQPSSWRTAKNGADYIAVTRKDLISSLQPLANQRKSQGLKTSVVDIEDVYDEFSFGHKTPQALKDFFVYTKTSWKIGPRFAVLAGDATYDPKNYTGVGDFDVVPTRLFESAFSETATDDWFVDFNEDAVPDIAIGRLPVRTPQETATLAEKIISYDSSESVNRVLLVVDHNDGYDFEAADNQLQSLIPATLTVIGIRRGQVGDSAARTQLLNELNLGAKFVNFYGHGSTLVWTNASILTAADAASLGNTDRLALFDAMTCFNGFFHDVSIASLGEALLKAPGGAIAVWASSGMTDAGGQVQMNEEAMRQLFGGGGLTIGEVTARAKAATGNPDVRATWILLGDPATKLK